MKRVLMSAIILVFVTAPAWAGCDNNTKDPNEAIRDCTKIIDGRGEIKPPDMQVGMAYNNRGSAYANQKKTAEAIADLSEAIKWYPFKGEYYNRGLAYAAQQDYDAALKDFQAGLDLNPNTPMGVDDMEWKQQMRFADGVLHVAKGETLRTLKRNDEAIAEFKAAAKIGGAAKQPAEKNLAEMGQKP